MMNDDGVVHCGFIHQSFLVSCFLLHGCMQACKHANDGCALGTTVSGLSLLRHGEIGDSRDVRKRAK